MSQIGADGSVNTARIVFSTDACRQLICCRGRGGGLAGLMGQPAKQTRILDTDSTEFFSAQTYRMFQPSLPDLTIIDQKSATGNGCVAGRCAWASGHDSDPAECITR